MLTSYSSLLVLSFLNLFSFLIMAQWFVSLLVAGAGAVAVAADLPLKIETRSGVRSRVTNIHFSSNEVIDGDVTFTYGSCSSNHHQEDDGHFQHTIARTSTREARRLVWVFLEDAETGGCISAWVEFGALVGRSEPQTLHGKWKKRALKRDSEPPVPERLETDTSCRFHPSHQ